VVPTGDTRTRAQGSLVALLEDQTLDAEARLYCSRFARRHGVRLRGPIPAAAL